MNYLETLYYITFSKLPEIGRIKRIFETIKKRSGNYPTTIDIEKSTALWYTQEGLNMITKELLITEKEIKAIN